MVDYRLEAISCIITSSAMLSLTLPMLKLLLSKAL